MSFLLSLIQFRHFQTFSFYLFLCLYCFFSFLISSCLSLYLSLQLSPALFFSPNPLEQFWIPFPAIWTHYAINLWRQTEPDEKFITPSKNIFSFFLFRPRSRFKKCCINSSMRKKSWICLRDGWVTVGILLNQIKKTYILIATWKR